MCSPRLALALIMVALLTAAPVTAHGATKVVGAIVAVVNGEPITIWQVRRRVEPFLRAQRSTSKPWQWPDAVRAVLREAVQREIELRLFAAAARSKGVIVDRVRIDAQLARVAAESGRPLDHYLAEMLAAGWSEEALREEIRVQILEWDVLRREWADTHDTPEPSGEQWQQWRKQWLAERKAAACIELRIPNTP